MTDKIVISKFDVKNRQRITWVVTLSFLIIVASVIFYSFTLNGLYTIIMVLIITVIINYAGAKIWNIWYEHDFLIIENIYSTKKVLITRFKKIEMTSVFNNSYTLHLDNDEKYQFQIKPSEDLKLFFKTDSQFYAKQMTERLNAIKQNL